MLGYQTFTEDEGEIYIMEGDDDISYVDSPSTFTVDHNEDGSSVSYQSSNAFES